MDGACVQRIEGAVRSAQRKRAFRTEAQVPARVVGGDAAAGRALKEPELQEARREPEPLPEREREEAGAGGGADQREPREVEADGSRARALPDDHVELEVLERRVQQLLDRAGEAVDLVDEQDVALLEVGEDG